MVSWNESDFAAHEARRLASSLKGAMKSADAVEKESLLHSQILTQCRQRGWIAIHGSMAQKSSVNAGTPDFIILQDAGNVLMVECKTKTGKLSQEQLQFHALARRLGHTIHVVRSYQEFLNIL